MTDRERFNPLVLDPDDYERLFDEDFTEEKLEEKNDEYEHLSWGARRKRPICVDMS